MINANEKHNYKGGSKMAVFTKPNKFTYAIKKEFSEQFIKSTNTKQENMWVKEKADVFKANNLKDSNKGE